MNAFYQRARRLLIGTLVVYGLLVATHLGEFWPFSIYPMFSQGGNPWTRALVRDASELPDSLLWRPATLDDVGGDPFPMRYSGVNQNDVANFVSKSKSWNARRVAAMRDVFDESLGDRRLLIYRAEGRIVEGDSVAVTLTPFIALDRDTAAFNPTLTLSFD